MGVYIGIVPSALPLETTYRPDAGLARGVWEAPSWFFFVVSAAVVLVTGLYFLRRDRGASKGVRGKR